ncbi:hypothetical protein [Lysinibacillus xylanilyticus]|uniref:hypothetical protein n=1 Tax=Lysinibacillus xylanilyticus TaxID=582475 RepID=UPI00381E8861
MRKYIYTLPYQIRSVNKQKDIEEIITQKSSIIMENSPLFALLKEILCFSNNQSLDVISLKYKNSLSESKLHQLIDFLEKHNLIYISEELLKKEEIRLVEFISQYTTNIQRYLNQIKNLTFQVYSYGENIDYLTNVLKGFGIKYNLFDLEDINKFDKNNIILVSINALDLNHLEDLSIKIENIEGLLWAFTMYYNDSFLLSPILNQINSTDFNSFKNQIDLKSLNSENCLSKNYLVQNMAVNMMVLEVLTSIMKLNIQTSYNYMMVYNSAEKEFTREKIYYYPEHSKYKGIISTIQRWDDEA